MQLDQLWAEATAATNQSLSTNQIKLAMTKQSTSHVATLTHRLQAQRNWALGFLALWVVGIIGFWGNPLALLAMVVAAALYTVGALVLHFGIRRLQAYASTTQTQPQLPTQKRLEAELQIVKRTLYLNHVWSVLSLPLLVLVGLMCGYTLKVGDGATLESLFGATKTIFAAIISLVVVVPAALLLGQYMTRHAFGNLTQELQVNLEALRRLDTLGGQ